MDDDGTSAKAAGSVGEPPMSGGALPADAARLNVALLDAQGGVLASYTFRQSFTAGRAPDNMVVVDDDGVSRHHIEVQPIGGRWRIRDLGSANGVFIDGRRIESEEELVLPAVVSLGGCGAWLSMTRAPRAAAPFPEDRAGWAAVSAPPGRPGSESPPQHPAMPEPPAARKAAAASLVHPAEQRGGGGPEESLRGTPDDNVGSALSAEVLTVTVLAPDGGQTATFKLTASFSVGRSSDNTIVLDDAAVSRRHLEVRKCGANWQLIDLGSANGVYLNDALIERAAELPFPAMVVVGRSGICLQITKSSPTPAAGDVAVPDLVSAVPQADRARPGRDEAQSRAPEDIKARLLDDDEAEDAGEYTRIVRRIIREDRVIRKKSYRKVIWALGILFGLSICMAAYQQIALANTRRLALEMFHDIKTLEVSLGQAEIGLEESADTLAKTMEAISSERLRIAGEQLRAEREKIAAERKRMLQEREKLATMKSKYKQYVEEANSLRLRFPGKRYEEELIARVASELGESELELPDEFVSEVRKYIKYWQGSPRMQKAIDNMEQNNYLPIVAGALKKHGLRNSQGCLATAAGDGPGIWRCHRASGGGCGLRRSGCPFRLPPGHPGRREVPQAHLQSRGTGFRPAGHGQLQLWRYARPQDDPGNARRSAGKELLEAHQAVSVAQGDARLRFLHPFRRRHRRGSETLRVQVQPATLHGRGGRQGGHQRRSAARRPSSVSMGSTG